MVIRWALQRAALTWRDGAVVARALPIRLLAGDAPWFEAAGAEQALALTEFDAVLMRQVSTQVCCLLDSNKQTKRIRQIAANNHLLLLFLQLLIHFLYSFIYLINVRLQKKALLIFPHI